MRGERTAPGGVAQLIAASSDSSPRALPTGPRNGRPPRAPARSVVEAPLPCREARRFGSARTDRDHAPHAPGDDREHGSPCARAANRRPRSARIGQRRVLMSASSCSAHLNTLGRQGRARRRGWTATRISAPRRVGRCQESRRGEQDAAAGMDLPPPSRVRGRDARQVNITSPGFRALGHRAVGGKSRFPAAR